MASPRVLDGLWVALARRARRWADRVLAERGTEPTSPAQPPADTGEPFPDDGPPAHWLEMVRARAPHLLPVRDRAQGAARPRAEDEAETEIAMPDGSVADLVRGDDGPVQRTSDVAGERPHRAAAQASAPAHASTSVATRRRAAEAARAAEMARPPEITEPRALTRPAARAREREMTEPGDVSRPPETSGVREIARPTTPWSATGSDAGAPLPGDDPTPATRRHDLGSTPDDRARAPTSWRDAPPPPGAAAMPTSSQRERTPRPASTQPQASWSSGPRGAAPGQTVWQREALRRGEADADGDVRPAPRPRADDAPPFASAPPVPQGSPPAATRGEGEIERRQRTIHHPAPTAIAPGAHRPFAPGDIDAMRPPPPSAADAIATAPRQPLASLAPIREAPSSSALWPRLPDEQSLDLPSVPGDLAWPQLPVDDLALADGPGHSEDRGRFDRLRLEQRGMRWSERRF